MPPNVNASWQVQDRFLELHSRWMTLIAEHWQDAQGQRLEYWRIEKADSIIVLPIQAGDQPRILVPPAQVALTIILQAYTGASDDEAIEALLMDRRWQLVLDCLDCGQAPFSKATLVRGHQGLIKRRLDRRLVERTVELATQRGGFGPRQLRVALDSSPLRGAGRVEDTHNLLGHVMRKAVGVVAARQGRELSDISESMGTSLLTQSSLKAGLDINWDDPEARCDALQLLVNLLDTVTTWVEQGSPPALAAQAALTTAQQVKTQDIEVSDSGTP